MGLTGRECEALRGRLSGETRRSVEPECQHDADGKRGKPEDGFVPPGQKRRCERENHRDD